MLDGIFQRVFPIPLVPPTNRITSNADMQAVQKHTDLHYRDLLMNIPTARSNYLLARASLLIL